MTLYDQQVQALLSGNAPIETPIPAGGGAPAGTEGGGAPAAAGGAPAGNEGGGAPAAAAAGEGGGAPAGAPVANPFAWETETQGLFKSQDEFKTRLPEIQDVLSKREKIMDVYDHIENPYPNSEMQERAEVMRAFKVDEGTARLIVDVKNTEDINTIDPIRVVAISRMISDPVVKEMGLDKAMELVKEEFDYDENGSQEGNLLFGKKASFERELLTSKNLLNEKTSTISQKKSIFAQREEQRAGYTQKKEAAQAAWQGPEARAKFANKIEISLGEEKLGFEAGAEEFNQLLEDGIKSAVNLGLTPDDPKAIEHVQRIVELKMFDPRGPHLARIIAQAINNENSSVKEAANRFYHNMAPIQRAGAQGGGSGPVDKSQAVLDYLNSKGQ